LLRNEHASPFEQVVLTFHTKMPIFVARQWVRHRTARLNEISGRYSIMKEEFYVPEADSMRQQSMDNKQARGEEGLPAEHVGQMIEEMRGDQATLYKHYEGMVEQGLAREIARVNLPLSLYTEWYWQIDLHNLFHFLKLRLDSHAQYEIREYASAMAKCAQAVAPIAYEAFEEHVKESIRFSRSELVALRRMLSGEEANLSGRAEAIFNQKLEMLNSLAEIEEPEEPAPPKS
ncbi:MAG: FAD-dependent thymidylate synthase, partial [Fimbriimonadaceae bacterium]